MIQLFCDRIMNKLINTYFLLIEIKDLKYEIR